MSWKKTSGPSPKRRRRKRFDDFAKLFGFDNPDFFYSSLRQRRTRRLRNVKQKKRGSQSFLLQNKKRCFLVFFQPLIEVEPCSDT